MATGGIQDYLAKQGAHVRIEEAALTAEEDKEYGGWKRLGMALGHFADIVERNERDGYFTVGLLATCPSMPGLVAGPQRSGPADSQVVMAGVRLTDPLEQELLDASAIQQVSVDDLRRATPAVFAQLDRLSRTTDKIYIHIDMDVLDPREVDGHQNKVPNGPSSEALARLFEMIFSRYPRRRPSGSRRFRPPTREGCRSLR
jgi:arginase family enzyme